MLCSGIFLMMLFQMSSKGKQNVTSLLLDEFLIGNVPDLETASFTVISSMFEITMCLPGVLNSLLYFNKGLKIVIDSLVGQVVSVQKFDLPTVIQ